MSLVKDCKYCFAAYPVLADDPCSHSDDPRIVALALELAKMVHGDEIPDEAMPEFLQDADSIIGDWPDGNIEWHAENLVYNPELIFDVPPVEFGFTLNDIYYVIQKSEWEPSRPVKYSEYISWFEEE